MAVPVLCLLLLGLASLGSVQVGSIQDDAWYLVTADALAQGAASCACGRPDRWPKRRCRPVCPCCWRPYAQALFRLFSYRRRCSRWLPCSALFCWPRLLPPSPG